MEVTIKDHWWLWKIHLSLFKRSSRVSACNAWTNGSGRLTLNQELRQVTGNHLIAIPRHRDNDRSMTNLSSAVNLSWLCFISSLQWNYRRFWLAGVSVPDVIIKRSFSRKFSSRGHTSCYRVSFLSHTITVRDSIYIKWLRSLLPFHVKGRQIVFDLQEF